MNSVPTIMLAGQLSSKPKPPALCVNIPESSQILLDINPGSQVCSPSTPMPKTATANTPLTYVFFDWDNEKGPDSPLQDEDGDAQIITIPHGNAFYSPPKLALTPPTPTFTQSATFACGALADRSPARVFHEELERLIRLNDSPVVIDVQSLEEMEMELLVSPVDVFSELCMDSMAKNRSTYQSTGIWKALPDVPYDLESLDADLEDMEEDFGDEDYSSDEAVTPLGRNVFELNAPLDRRLVAPFEFDNRSSVVPSKPLFCGLFS